MLCFFFDLLEFILYKYGNCKQTKIPQKSGNFGKNKFHKKKSLYELNWIFLVAKNDKDYPPKKIGSPITLIRISTTIFVHAIP
jgi:hypothetical protein